MPLGILPRGWEMRKSRGPPATLYYLYRPSVLNFRLRMEASGAKRGYTKHFVSNRGMLTFRLSCALLSFALLGPHWTGALFAQTAVDSVESMLGQHVVAVRVVGEQDRVIAQDPSNLQVQAGRALERTALRDTLHTLYATGRFSDIVAQASPVSGGIRVDFRVIENFFVGNVRIEGLREPPSDSQALGTLRLVLGEAFRRRDLDRGLNRLEQVLRANGFYNPGFAPLLERRPDTHLVDITVRVKIGARARLGQLSVTNPTSYPAADLVHASRLKPHQTLTSARLEKGAERVRNWLFKRGFYAARVSARPGDYNAAQNSAPINLEISAGSPVKLEVVGVKLSSGRLKQLVPIFQEGSVDEDLLAEGRRNIRDYFERRGYIDCEVQYTSTANAESGARDIVYNVATGSRRRLVAVEFAGNKYFSEELLRGQLTIHPSEVFRPAIFSRRLLQQNEDALRALYISNGFAAAKVQSETVEDYHGRPEELLARFHIEEGPQTLVESLEITGNSALPTSDLLAAIGSRPKQPYSDAGVASDRDNILALYLDSGLPEARFESHATPGSEAGRVRLAYQISEGQRVTVAAVIVGGNEHTRIDVIKRRVELKPEEPLREGDVITTQRRLYNLGIFSHVAVAPENPQGDETDKTMLVNVQEGQRFSVGYGAGFEVQPLNNTNSPTETSLDFAPRGIVEFTWANFLGRAQTLELRVRASTLQGRALAQYSAPQIFNLRNWNFQIIGFAEKTRDIRTFTSTRYEGSLLFEQHYSRITTFVYRYTFRRVLAGDLRIAPEEIPLFSQPTKISGPSFAWIRDARDNPANPTRGRFYTADVGFFPRTLGSTASFLRLYVQNSTFTPLGHHLVFARSTRFGLETPFGDSLSTDIPLAERFFAGGGTNLRGFGLNQAGPRDTTTGFPIGGLALLTFNQELRFPLRLPFTTAAITGAVFYDAGNVYTSIRTISFRTTPSPTNLNWLSHAIGFGVNYPTPVGPIRMDFGYLLNSPRFQVCADTSAACPSATNPAMLDRQHRFQFFLTFGAPF